jgi:hypothetical protein
MAIHGGLLLCADTDAREPSQSHSLRGRSGGYANPSTAWSGAGWGILPAHTFDKWRSSYQMLSQHPGWSSGESLQLGAATILQRAIRMNPTGSQLKGAAYDLVGWSDSLTVDRGECNAELVTRGYSPGRTANLYVLDRSTSVPIILEECNG